jgi:hypothetical protein
MPLSHYGFSTACYGSLQGQQPSLVAQDVILQPGQHGLGSSLVIFARTQPEGRGYMNEIGNDTIFIAGGTV